MAKKVDGITVAIKADTSGVAAGLKDLTTQSVSLTKQLKTVDSLLDMDPGNTELIAAKQRLLSESAETSKKKLEALKAAQENVEKAFQKGDLGSAEYVAFQKELVQTGSRLRDLEAQSQDTGEEINDLGDDAQETGTQLKKAGDESSGFGEKLKTGLTAGAKAAAAALAAVTAAAAATVASIIDATGETAEYGDNIDKMSQKLGMSAQSYQEWDFIMQHSGSDIDKMTTSMKTLSEAVVDQSDKSVAAFSRLGISMEDAANMSQEELFSATVTALQGMESGAERTALATDLLGKSAMDLGALLNTSAEETEAMRQQVHDLGGVMSDDAVKASAAYQDSLQNAKTAVDGFGREIGASFMPAITQMMDGFSALVAGDDEAVAGIEDGLQAFIENAEQTAEKIAEAADHFIPIIVNVVDRSLPKLLGAAAKIVGKIANGILNNLPVILGTGAAIIANLAESLVKALPQIVRTGLTVIAQLAQGIAQALPELIPTVIDVVLEIVDILTNPDTLSTLIDASIAIVIALTDGIIDSLPALIERLPELVDQLVNGIIDNLDKLLDAAVQVVEKFAGYLFDPENADKIVTAGMEIITKIVRGLGGALWKITAKVKEIAKEIADKLGIGKYWEAGQDVIDRFMDGVKAKWDEWASWWEGIGERIFDWLHPDFSGDSMIDESAVWQPPVPAMASGGIVTRPTRALIGENGREAVIPLENNTGFLEALANRLGGSGVTIESISIVVPAGSDGRQIARSFAAELDAQLRQYQITGARGTGGTGWRT